MAINRLRKMFGRKGVPFLDLSSPKPRGRKQSPRMRQLMTLAPDKIAVIDHSNYKTNFAAWIAQSRARTGRNYGYHHVGDNVYEVWLILPNTTSAPPTPTPGAGVGQLAMA